MPTIELVDEQIEKIITDDLKLQLKHAVPLKYIGDDELAAALKTVLKHYTPMSEWEEDWK